MIISMTGFGAASGQFEGRTMTVEVKSVNNRFREVAIRLPRHLSSLEENLKKMVTALVERGRVDLWVQMDERDWKRQRLSLDEPLARELKILLTSLKNDLDLSGEISLEHLLSLGVIKPVEESPDLEALGNFLRLLLKEALADLSAMRRAEGENLACDLLIRLDLLAGLAAQVGIRAAEAPETLLEKLKVRLAELTAGHHLDPGRLAQEAAFLADRADITEELVRFQSHLERFRGIMKQEGPVGRKLDFLLQELGREVNTMGSKSQNQELSGLVLDMKSELEKLREQVQNIE